MSRWTGFARRSRSTPCARGQNGLRHAAASVPAERAGIGSQCSEGPSSAANRGTSGLPRLRRRAWPRPSQLRPNVVRGRRARRRASRRGSQRRGLRRHALRPRRAARQHRRPRRLPEPHAVRPRIRAEPRRMAHSAIESGSSAAVSSALPIAASRVPSSSAPSISASASRYASSFASASFSTRDRRACACAETPRPSSQCRRASWPPMRSGPRPSRSRCPRRHPPRERLSARRSRRARRAGRGRTDPSSGSLRRIELGEAGTQRFGERGAWLIAGRGERSLEVRDEANAERRVLARPLDDLIELATCLGKLLRGLHPAGRCRRQHAEQFAQAFLVVWVQRS